MKREHLNQAHIKTRVPDNEMGHDFEPDDQIKSEASVLKKQSNAINNSSNSHVCSECFKEFSSGKALGGHMRIHAQVFKKRDDRNQLNRGGGGGGGDGVIKKQGKFSEEPVCCVCSKSFGSWKSLFGHMRCHPDRKWRGVVPPQEKVSDNYEEDLDDDDDEEEEVNEEEEEERVVDLGYSLGAWSVRARRGGKGRRGGEGGGSSSDFKEEEEEEDETLINAASDLLMLNQLVSFDDATSKSVTNNNNEEVDVGGVFEEEKLMAKGKGKSELGEEVEEEELDFVNEKNGGGDYIVLEKGKGKAVFVENFDGDESDGCKAELVVQKKENNNNKKCLDGKVMKKKKAKKMKTIMDLDSFEEHDVKAENGAERYKCATCKKTFPTHQALGGHRSSHNKFKMNIFDVIPQQQQQQHQASSAALLPDYQWEFNHQQPFEQQLHQNQANISEEMLVTNNVELSASDHSSAHECRTCSKTFPSGQTPGGHMRCHWPGPSLEPAPLAPSADLSQLAPSSGEEASQDVGRSRPALEFDLNEMPPMEEEEEEGYEVDNAAEEAALYSYGCF